MTNDFRDLDDLIGLDPVSDMPPPMLGGLQTGPVPPAPAPPAPAPVVAAEATATTGTPPQVRRPNLPTRVARTTTRSTRPTRARRPTAVRPPTVNTLTRVSPPGAVRPPTRAVGVTASTRPLLSAVSAPIGRRGAEPVTPVVTLIAWLLMLLAAGNSYLMLRTRGWISNLPFTGQVDYSPTVTALMTWAGHPGWPTWLSVLGAAGLAVAAVRTRGLRQVGGGAGATLFVSLLLALAGMAGSLAALLVVAFATAIGIAVVVAITALLVVGLVLLLVGLVSG
jgi:hypothetical protein